MSDKQDFLLERYKYVLNRKRELNSATFKITALYQAAIGFLASAEFTVLRLHSDSALRKSIAILATDGVFVLFLTTTTLTVCLFVGGIASWIKYRRDETEIERSIGRQGRSLPGIRGMM